MPANVALPVVDNVDRTARPNEEIFEDVTRPANVALPVVDNVVRTARPNEDIPDQKTASFCVDRVPVRFWFPFTSSWYCGELQLIPT